MKSIICNKLKILNTTEKIITNPPTANKVFTPLMTELPKDTKKTFSSLLIKLWSSVGTKGAIKYEKLCFGKNKKRALNL